MARRWSDEELAVGLNRSLSAVEAADQLDRSVKAVLEIRAKYPPGRNPVTSVPDVDGLHFTHPGTKRVEPEGVANWQGTTNPVAQKTLDTLLYTVLSLAVDNLRSGQGFEPFAVAARGEFQHALIEGAGENDCQRRDNLVRQLAAQANRVTAFAMAHNTPADASGRDAVEIRLEHRDGLAVVVYAPYIKLGKAIAVGQLTAEESATESIW